MTEYLDRIFHPRIAAAIRWLMHVGALLVILWGFFWNFSGPIIESYANEILEKKLIQLGVSPKAVAEMQAQGIRNGANIVDLANDAEMIRRDIQAVKDQTRAISGKQDTLTAQGARIEVQVDRIVDALLNRNPQ